MFISLFPYNRFFGWNNIYIIRVSRIRRVRKLRTMIQDAVYKRHHTNITFLRIEIVWLCFPMTLSCIKYLSVFCHSIMEFHESNLTKCITFLQIHLGDWIGCFSASFSRFKVIFHIFGLSLRQFSAYYELVFGLWTVVVPQRFFGTALGMQRRFFGPWVLNPSLLYIQD
jgi:hypothetical protein